MKKKVNFNLRVLILFSVSIIAINTQGQIKLGATYPNETWSKAKINEYSWLIGEWFWPTLPGFISRFKIENGKLYRQNEGDHFEHFITEWVETEVFISNNNILRIWHNKEEWDGTFILRKPNNICEFYENERFVKDNGEVGSGEKRLVLSVDKCKIRPNGWIYDCDCDKK